MSDDVDARCPNCRCWFIPDEHPYECPNCGYEWLEVADFDADET